MPLTAQPDVWCLTRFLRVHRRYVHRLGAALLCLAAPASGLAQGPSILLPPDRIVRIQAKVGDDAAFVGGLTLTAPEAVPDLSFKSSDLRRSDGQEVIRSSQVMLPGVSRLSLAASTPRDIEVKVGGVRLPGLYTGTLYFLLPNQQTPEALALQLELTALSVPELTQRKGSESLRIQLFDCAGLGCAIARWLQPAAFLSTYPLPLDNSTLEPFDVTATLSAVGEVHRMSIDGTLSVPKSMRLEPLPVVTLPISVTAGSRPLPDHYVGDVQVRAQSAEAAIRVPLEVNVRTGPLVPMFVVLAGILLGRCVKYMKDRGGPQSDLLFKLYQLEGEIAAAPADHERLRPMLDAVRARIYAMDLQAATSDMTALDARRKLLQRLRGVEDNLQGRSEPSAPAVVEEIKKARRLILAGKDAEATALVAQIETAMVVTEAVAGAAFDLGAPPQTTTATTEAVKTTSPERDTWYVRLLSALTGVSSGLRAELTLWMLRPLMYLLLIAGLTVVGLLQLYLKNATFGSDPVSDYFGLLVWGMSSDVASRTLAALKS